MRECAWDSFRPYLVQDLSAGLILLEAWVRDTDPNIRRFASEVTRPRGVWTPHIPELKDDPQQALGLLEPLKSDPSRYVQNSVANWLNDASKSQPDWVQAVCARWLDESPTKETAYIVKRALRTLRKQGVVAAKRREHHDADRSDIWRRSSRASSFPTRPATSPPGWRNTSRCLVTAWG